MGYNNSFCICYTYLALETVLMPFSFQRNYGLVWDWSQTALALGCKYLLEIFLTVWFAVSFEKCRSRHWLLAWTTAGEVVFMPALAQRLNDFLKQRNIFLFIYLHPLYRQRVLDIQKRFHTNLNFTLWYQDSGFQ